MKWVEQLRLQRPGLLLTLGVYVPQVIAPLSPQLTPWASRRGSKQLDSVGPVQREATFPGVEDFRTTVVALLHPSLRHASLRHRNYAGVVGVDAELAMLRDGLPAAAAEGQPHAVASEQ